VATTHNMVYVERQLFKYVPLKFSQNVT